jgi:uncharacterized protein DUF488
MNTPFSNQFFYLSDDTYYEFHDADYCSCAQPQSRPHSFMVASLYKLDGRGLKALEVLLMTDDEVDFEEWLEEQNAQTYYGSDKQAARASAIQQARKDGKLIINRPEEFPWILPLAGVLRDILGYGGFDDGGCLPMGVCECNSTHTREQTVCRACYAHFVCDVLHTFIYKHIREYDSKGNWF